jgi:aspartate/methionine/tyrosine aminotransferase
VSPLCLCLCLCLIEYNSKLDFLSKCLYIHVLIYFAAFAWLKCEGNVEDCESFLRVHNIITRSGKHFGVSPKYVRISLLDTDENFTQFLDRLSTTIQSM